MPADTVIFVQGSKKAEIDFPWMFFHFDPQKEVSPGPVKLVFFDYPAGRRKTWKKIVLKRGKAPTQAPDEDVAITPTVNPRASDGSVDTSVQRPSALAVYQFIMALPQGSVRSLQIFSHGWVGGPIVWNTSELGPGGENIEDDNSADRDPHDTDFRVRDFFGNNLLSVNKDRTKFTDAFDPLAFVKFWGCVAPDGIRPLVQKFDFAAKTERAKLANDVRLEQYLDHIENSYAYVFAENVGVTVWAAPIGWGSDPWTNIPTSKGKLKVTYKGTFPPDLKKHRWWRVSWFFRNQDRGVQFYEQVLKAEVDRVDFVGYSSAWFGDARDALEKREQDRRADDFARRMTKALRDRVEEIMPGRLVPPTSGTP